ncbi:MAG: hypothetical protein ACI836_001617 [Saprospiraceae bacterium]|jgi:hypothetical protein
MDSMKFKIWIISAVILSIFSSCDDGDLIVTSFDFETQTLQICGGETAVVFFKINNDAQESIALNITGSSEIFLQETIADINLSTSSYVAYRKFNGDVDASYFCASIPPVAPQVSVEYLAESGVARLNNSLVLDDQDGIPEALELNTIEGTTLDTDNDTIPNYYDLDDDGDNVPTILEIFASNDDGDDNPLTPIKDTDGDGTPDYLDPDDDGDGILTRNESTDGNIDPTDDFNDDTSGLPDFLNAAIAIEGFEIEDYIEHFVKRNASVVVILSDLVLTNEAETIVQESLNMGTIPNVIDDTALLITVFQ